MQWDQKAFEAAAQQAAQSTGVAVRCTGWAMFSQSVTAGRFALPNGLTVIVAPDYGAPLFAYQTWFKVGSKDEDPKRTGLAHLFEHLMFKGTTTHASGVFDREMERRGAQTNAATWVDWTYYTEALAARDDNLQTVIDFESDRMVNLVFDAQTFTSELEVVKNERRMSVEDSIIGSLSERLMAQCFTQHPYTWPTIGSMAHLEAASLDDLRAFYRQFYNPTNATVVVCGSIDVSDTLGMLAKAYGPLAGAPVVRRPKACEPAQRAARIETLHRPMLAPQLLVAYAAPPQSDPRYCALEMLAEVLAGGDSARLYQRMVVDEQIATEVGGSPLPFAEPGLFEFHLALRPDADPDAALHMLQDELDRLALGITTQEFDKARNTLELGLLEGLRDIEGRAEALGHFETNEGDFGRAFSCLSALQQITPAMLQQVACDTFTETARTTIVGKPKAA